MSSSPPHDASQSKPSHPTDIKRRRLLFALGAGSAGAAAAAVPIANAVESSDAQASEAKGYRETDHVRDYYATTRL